MKENRVLEFKSEVSNTFLKTVSAFANFGTGEIKFGYTDDGVPLGLPNLVQVCLDIENKINDSISPKPDYEIETDEVSKTVTLRVLEGQYKPYLYKSKAYRRSDSATIEVDGVELKRLILEGSHAYFDEMPCHVETLSFETLSSKLHTELGIENLTSDILRTLGLMTHDKKYNNAAALLADENGFPGIDIIKFGYDIDEIEERETIDHQSILRQLSQAVQFYRRYYQYEKIVGMERTRMERVPESAFREAVANALVHRTWDVRAHIRISMYSDRIEIASPGGLPEGLSREEYLKGYISSLRNPTVGNVFFRLHYIEMFGTGIRKIIKAYRESECQPSFDVTENAVVVTLPCLNLCSSMTTEAQCIYRLLRNTSSLSSSEIAQQTSWHRDKVIRVLKSLIAQHIVQVQGKGKNTRYSVKN